MKLAIIIVNYNTALLTSACIKAILKEDYSFDYEIVVVDNASSDDSVALLRSDWPEVKVINNEENLGLAAGVNIGIKESRGEYILVLNPDIVVLHDAIEKLVKYLDGHERVGMVGGKLLSPNGKLQFSCYRFYRLRTIVYRRTLLGKTKQGKKEVSRFLMKDYDHKKARDVDWLMGACLMVKREAVKEVEGMDETFFLYFEDVDWCRRFWESGWRVVYEPEAKFSHYHQRSSEIGGIMGLVRNWIAREHIWSAIKYFWKYRGKKWPVRVR